MSDLYIDSVQRSGLVMIDYISYVLMELKCVSLVEAEPVSSIWFVV